MNTDLDWFNLLFNSDQGLAPAGPETMLFVLFLSFLIGHFIGWIYMLTHRSLSYSQAFVGSLVAIPVIVAMMMVLMAGSIIVAFGLLAVFAVVRFRNVLKDTRDTTFILWAIMEGLAVGTMRSSTALIVALGVAGVLLYLRMTAFGSRHRFDAVLTLLVTGDPGESMAAVDRVLHRHSMRADMTGRRHVVGEGLNLSYRVLLRDPARSEELETSLRETEGVDRVSLFLREDEAEV
jgi:hypothetical protein